MTLRMKLPFKSGIRVIHDRRPRTDPNGNAIKNNEGETQYEKLTYRLDSSYSPKHKRDSKKRISLYTPQGEEINQDIDPKTEKYVDERMSTCKSKAKQFDDGKEFKAYDEEYVMDNHPGMFEKS